MNISLTADSLAELTSIDAPVCLSLYQPTHRSRPDNQQDPIRFQNLVKELEASLRKQFSVQKTDELLAPFHELARDHEFWIHTLDGLAVMAAPGFFRVFRLQRPMPELAIVADSFHTKPLRRFLQTVDRYQVLGLTRTKFRLFEGNRHTLDEIELPEDMPTTLEEALGTDLTEPRQTVSAYGGAKGQGAGMNTPMHHGHGGRKGQLDLDAERFFRVVDREVCERYSKDSKLPLILVALTEHHHMFHKISRNNYLLKEGVQVNPEALTIEELRERVWERVEPEYRERQEALANAFAEAKAHGRGSDELEQVAEASACGRVSILLVESGRQIPGRLDRETGRVDRGQLDDPQVDDLLDDLGELVEGRGGEVRVIPPERMPVETGLAAVYRH